jgi:hypothetical protein
MFLGSLLKIKVGIPIADFGENALGWLATVCVLEICYEVEKIPISMNHKLLFHVDVRFLNLFGLIITGSYSMKG